MKIYTKCDDIKVSVIIPVFNRENCVKRSIESVQRQSLQEIEIICVDDGSTDQTKETIQNMVRTDNRIKYCYQTNQGAGVARNVGIQRSKGRYVAFLDSDDQYHDKKSLEVLYRTGEEHNAALCAGKLSNNINGKYTDDYTKNIKGICERYISFRDHQDVLGFTSFIYKREFLLDNSIVFPEYRYSEDPPFLLDALIKAGGFWFAPIFFYEIIGHERIGSIRDTDVRDALEATAEMLKKASDGGYAILYRKLIDSLNIDYYEGIMRNLNQHTLSALLRILEINSQSRFCQEISLMDDIQKAVCTYVDNQERIDFPKNLAEELMTIERHKDLLNSYFEENGIKRIVIYGLGKFGKAFYRLIKDTNIETVAYVDAAREIFMGGPVLRPEDDFPSHDAVIITMQYTEGAIKVMEDKKEERILLFTDIIETILM